MQDTKKNTVTITDITTAIYGIAFMFVNSNIFGDIYHEPFKMLFIEKHKS